MMCRCGMPGKNRRQIRWVIPYCSTKGLRSLITWSGLPMRKRSFLIVSRSVAIAASMKGCFQPPAYSRPVGHHDVLLRELARFLVGLGDDHVAGERPLGEGRGEAGGLAIGEELLLALEQAGELGGGTGNPVVGERGRPPQRHARPSRRSRSGDAAWRRASARACPRPGRSGPCATPVLGPQRLHDGELLLEPRAALLELGAIEGELVGLVADGRADDQPPAGHHVQHGATSSASRTGW